MKRFYCTKCGREAKPGPRPPDKPPVKFQAPFTRIDGKERYDLGHCDCTKHDLVELVDDPIQAEVLVEERLDRKRRRMRERDELDPTRIEKRKAASVLANKAKAAYAAMRKGVSDGPG